MAGSASPALVGVGWVVDIDIVIVLVLLGVAVSFPRTVGLAIAEVRGVARVVLISEGDGEGLSSCPGFSYTSI